MMPQPSTSLYGLTVDEFREFAATSPNGLVVVLEDPVFRLFANPAGRRQLGLAGRDADALALQELPGTTLILESDEERSLADWLIKQIDTPRKGRRADISVVRNHEHAVDLLAVINCLQSPSADRRGCVVTLMDVSGERWLGQQLAHRAAQQSLAAAYSNSLLVKADAEAAMRRACDTIARGLNFEFALFMEIDDPKETLVVKAAAGAQADQGELAARAQLVTDSLVGRAFLQRGTVVRQHPDELSPPVAPAGPFKIGIATPVWIADEPRAVLAAFSANLASLHEQDVGFVENISMMASNGLSRILAEDRYLESVRQLERARATERINRAARLASLGTMVSGIAHEVKNPINAIHMNAELGKVYLEQKQDLREAKDCLSRIQSDCRRAADIADGILSFALGKEGQDRETVTLRELFAGVSRLAANMQGVQERMLDMEIGSPDLVVTLSRTDFEQALLNLVQNSFEAGASAVRLSAERVNSVLQIEVADDGPGIPEDLLPRVFDPFFTTRYGAGGSGLGLSLAHRIIADHGGQIDVDSQPGQGCRFTITLPAVSGNRDS
jgi:signal transduction histidine kinase